MLTPAIMMKSRAGSDFDSNQRFSGTGRGPKGAMAFGSYQRGLGSSLSVSTIPGAGCSPPPSMSAIDSSSRDAIRT